jgi:hypothetical protein
MKRLLFVIVLLACIWAGFWLSASTGLKSAFETWFEDRRAQGWVAEYSDLSVKGFPNRVDTHFSDLQLADPRTGWAWEAPFFQLLALSYRPNHVIAVWPNEQLLATPTQKIDITSNSLKASVVLAAGTRLPLTRANLVAETLTLQTRDQQATTMTALRAAIQQDEGAPQTYRFAVEAEDFAPPMSVRGLIGASDALPRTFSALRAQFRVGFDAPWDLDAIERQRPQPTHLDLTLAEARWGNLEIWLAGQADVDESGTMTGKFTIKLRNWRDILRMAVNSGQIPQGLGDQMEKGLGLLSQMAGNPNTLDVPLDLRRGIAFLGPIPVGSVPPLVLR